MDWLSKQFSAAKDSIAGVSAKTLPSLPKEAVTPPGVAPEPSGRTVTGGRRHRKTKRSGKKHRKTHRKHRK